MKEYHFQCDVCGKMLYRKIAYFGQTLCDKHYKQIKKYGHPIDTNPRTLYTPNTAHIKNDVVYIDLFDKHGEFVDQAMVDIKDYNKVRYTKWRKSGSGYAINNSKNSKNKIKGTNEPTLFMHRVILGTDQFVDHINHNKLDNRRSNLRIITKSQNQMNSNYRGVDDHNGKWTARIKLHGKIAYLGTYEHEEEAYYARWYAEEILFKEYRYPKEKPKIPKSRAKEIEKYVKEKVQRL